MQKAKGISGERDAGELFKERIYKYGNAVFHFWQYSGLEIPQAPCFPK
jgi:hypothetical protein